MQKHKTVPFTCVNMAALNIIYHDCTFFLCQPDEYIFGVDVEKMNSDSGCLKVLKVSLTLFFCFDRMIPKNDLELGPRND